MAETNKTKPAEKTERPINPWEDKLPVYFAKGTDNEPNYVRVVVNGRAYQIPRGRQQLVPRPVYEVISRSEHAKHITSTYDTERRLVERT